MRGLLCQLSYIAAPLAGFEPAAPASVVRCSNPLSYKGIRPGSTRPVAGLSGGLRLAVAGEDLEAAYRGLPRLIGLTVDPGKTC